VRTFPLFAGADLVGEFDTRDDAGRALDELTSGEPATADGLAIFEFEENGQQVGEPITRPPRDAA
jgi:hypothetical protein